MTRDDWSGPANKTQRPLQVLPVRTRLMQEGTKLLTPAFLGELELLDLDAGDCDFDFDLNFNFPPPSFSTVNFFHFHILFISFNFYTSGNSIRQEG